MRHLTLLVATAGVNQPQTSSREMLASILAEPPGIDKVEAEASRSAERMMGGPAA